LLLGIPRIVDMFDVTDARRSGNSLWRACLVPFFRLSIRHRLSAKNDCSKTHFRPAAASSRALSITSPRASFFRRAYGAA
jgi:hypothetical protein